MDGFAIGCFDGVLDRFADRRVGVDAVEDFVVGGFQLAAEDGFDDDLRYVVADHVGAQPFAVFGVEDHFYKAFGMTDAGSFTGGGQREFAYFDFVACVAGLFFGQADGGDLRGAIGTAGDIAIVERFGLVGVFLFPVGDIFDADDAFFCGYVGEGLAGDAVADGIDAGDIGLVEFVDEDLAFIGLDARGFPGRYSRYWR